MNLPKSVGIIGGGQLGMMLLEAAKSSVNQVKYTILESSVDCPAAPLADEVIVGSLKSESDIQKLAAASEVMTWEIEHIAVDALIELQKQGKTIIPKPEVLKIIQDKGIQKQFFSKNEIPTAPFLLMDASEIGASTFIHEMVGGDKLVIKTRTGGYDGKGVFIASQENISSGNMPFSGDLLVEKFADNALEVAVIVAVDQQGNQNTFPAIEMYFNPISNLVEFLFSPAQISQEIEIKSREIALKAVSALSSPGLFAVELFILADGEVWVNEIAPRPHNSGHHTIEGCRTSQFEQLNRILLGQTLGETALVQPSAMINIVGPEGISGQYRLENEGHWKSQTDVFVHMYNKSETRPHRKLGHVTVTAETFDELISRATEVKNQLRIIPS
jgi:5-(carboxyamino)imidazole ribonucleotide synthase